MQATVSFQFAIDFPDRIYLKASRWRIPAIMDESLKLYLIGFAAGIIVTIILDQSTEEDGFLKSFVTKGAQLWHLVFMIIVLTVLPFMAIEPLKKRFKRKTFVPFPILAGYGTGFILMGLIGMVLSLVNQV